MPVLSKKADIEYGLTSELKNKMTLECFFGCELKKTGTYDLMDFTGKNNTLYIELKTRRVDKDKYPTALIGKNKVDFCRKSTATCYFVYVYLNGIYYIKYDEALFSTFECSDFERGMRIGGIQPKQLFYFIPHEHLIPLTNESI